MHSIIVKTGAEIIEVTEGRKIPQIRTVGRSVIRTRATYLGDGVWKFKFQGKTWTVDQTFVEVVA